MTHNQRRKKYNQEERTQIRAIDDGISREGCFEKDIIIVKTYLEEDMNLMRK